MSITVKFASGEEKQFEADSASLEDHARLFVLLKWNPRKRRSESVDIFPAHQVAWARLPNGNLVLGKGRVKPE